MSPDPLPRVLLTTVIRGTKPGAPHGRLAVVDLSTGVSTDLLSWDLPVPAEAGGGARGLRGVAVAFGRIWVLSFGALLELGPDLSLRSVWSHPTLADAHQICVWGEQLVVVSTAFDALLAFDPRQGCFTWGCVLRGDPDALQVASFDPAQADTWPRARDTVHLNQVHAGKGVLWTSGLRLPYLVRLDGDAVEAVGSLPLGTHDVRPVAGGLVLHDTAADRLAFGPAEALRGIAVPQRDPLHLTHLGDGRSRAGFARGLVVLGEDRVAGGLSPASVHVYNLSTGCVDSSVWLTTDAREAVHGLCLWPADWAVPKGQERSAARRFGAEP